MNADLLPSTHPIQAVIKHTGDATSAFDAISYRKGASWIKTMDNFIGRKVLQEGLKDYVNAFAYKNAVLNDLVLCMNKAFKSLAPEESKQLDLVSWTDDWLKTTGPNTLEIKYSWPKEYLI